LSISNTWSWISQDDLPHIFDRFFKGEKSRNTQWFGIWLSLVKKICDMYDWKISVVSTLNEKTTFEMKFP
jgi:signal transduction histidine kinase